MPSKVDRERALGICARMRPIERNLVRVIPLVADAPVPDTGDWIARGWVTRVGDWCKITPAGQRVQWSRSTPEEARAWLYVLASLPRPDSLARFSRWGIITNVGGFPVLTAFGLLMQEEIHKADAYFATHPELMEEMSNDLLR